MRLAGVTTAVASCGTAFGAEHINVLRRLQRICRHYGSDPVFICSSATIANPRELAESLVERPFEPTAIAEEARPEEQH